MMLVAELGAWARPPREQGSFSLNCNITYLRASSINLKAFGTSETRSFTKECVLTKKFITTNDSSMEKQLLYVSIMSITLSFL